MPCIGRTLEVMEHELKDETAYWEARANEYTIKALSGMVDVLENIDTRIKLSEATQDVRHAQTKVETLEAVRGVLFK